MGLVFGRNKSRSTKPHAFPCKVAAGGDEGYLLCVVVAVWIVSGCFGCNRSSLGVLQHVDANRIVMACNGCMDVYVLLQNALY